jgi:hypothetical protein
MISKTRPFAPGFLFSSPVAGNAALPHNQQQPAQFGASDAENLSTVFIPDIRLFGVMCCCLGANISITTCLAGCKQSGNLWTI